MSQDYLDKLIEKDETGTQIQSIPLHDTELRGITIDEPITVEGNPINFSTKNEQNAIQTIVDIDPIQDLHGYTKPWVGGAGKNILPLTIDDIKTLNTIGTWNGNIYTPTGESNFKYIILVDSDNNVIGINVNGTPVKDAGLIFTNTLNGNEIAGYLLNGCPSGGSESSYYIRLQQNGGSWTDYAVDTGNGATISSSASSSERLLVCFIRVKAGTVTNNLIFYPMIRALTVTDATFEPYTNICPITPHEEIKIGGCGKNLCKPKVINNTTVNGIAVNVQKDNGGNIIEYSIPSNTANANVNIVLGEFTPNKDGQYIFSGFKINNATNNVRTFIWNETLSQSVVGTISDNSIIVSLVKDNWYLVALLVNNGYTVPSTIIKPMILISTETDTAYEPYTLSNQITLPLPEDIYGGTLNLETGEMVVDRKFEEFDGDNNEGWTADTNYRFYITRADFNSPERTEIANITANYITATKREDIDNKTWSVSGSGNAGGHTINVKFDSTMSDLATFKTYLSNNHLQLVYPLSTPYTIHLTPHQLKLFKDVNNLNSSDYTTLNVTYHSNSIATLTPATDTTDGLLTAMDKRALDRTEEIIEGNPIAFETESAQVAKSTIVDLEPIQDLHGFSKPWVGGAGKNLIPMTVDGVKAANTSGTWSGNVYTHNGITYTILVDSDNNIIGINANNTASANSYFALARNFVLSASTLISTSIDSNCYVECYDGTTFYSDLSGYQHTVPAGNIEYARITVKSGTALSNVKIYPMIRLSTVTDTTFEPYTNIAAISGRSEVDILGCGKNLCPTTGFQSSFTVSNANATQISGCHYKINGTISGAYWISFILGSQGKIPVDLPKGTYTVSASNPKVRCYIYWDEEFTEYMSESGSVTSANKPIKGIRFLIGDTTCDNEDIYLQLEIGSQATPYTPYQQFTSLQIQLGETVYGGTLDAEKGELVVDRASKDLGDLSWTYDSGVTYPYYYVTISDMLIGQSGNDYVQDDHYICSCYNKSNDINPQTRDIGNGTFSRKVVSGATTDVLCIRDTRYTDATNFTNAVDGETFVYPLATPTTITLTPEQVKLLSGVNTITTNADKITLTYRNGSVATLNDLESLYNKLKAYIDSLHNS